MPPMRKTCPSVCPRCGRPIEERSTPNARTYNFVRDCCTACAKRQIRKRKRFDALRAAAEALSEVGGGQAQPGSGPDSPTNSDLDAKPESRPRASGRSRGGTRSRGGNKAGASGGAAAAAAAAAPNTPLSMPTSNAAATAAALGKHSPTALAAAAASAAAAATGTVTPNSFARATGLPAKQAPVSEEEALSALQQIEPMFEVVKRDLDLLLGYASKLGSAGFPLQREVYMMMCWTDRLHQSLPMLSNGESAGLSSTPGTPLQPNQQQMLFAQQHQQAGSSQAGSAQLPSQPPGVAAPPPQQQQTASTIVLDPAVLNSVCAKANVDPDTMVDAVNQLLRGAAGSY